MADILEIIQGRRSVRNYQDKPVPEDVLNKVLEALTLVPVLGKQPMLGSGGG